MISVHYDGRRPRAQGRYHVRLIDTNEVLEGRSSMLQNQFGYWCDREHLKSMVSILENVLDRFPDKAPPPTTASPPAPPPSPAAPSTPPPHPDRMARSTPLPHPDWMAR
jgi:hypothetical protein